MRNSLGGAVAIKLERRLAYYRRLDEQLLADIRMIDNIKPESDSAAISVLGRTLPVLRAILRELMEPPE
jgi:hypothetical protein